MPSRSHSVGETWGAHSLTGCPVNLPWLSGHGSPEAPASPHRS